MQSKRLLRSHRVRSKATREVLNDPELMRQIRESEEFCGSGGGTVVREDFREAVSYPKIS
jgi:hypothetical protein